MPLKERSLNMYLIDTNILLTADINKLVQQHDKLGLAAEVVDELDNFKNEDGDRGYAARRALRGIEANSAHFEFLTKDSAFYCSYNPRNTYVDNILLSYNMPIMTNDLGLRLKAKHIGLETISYIETPEKFEPIKNIELPSSDIEAFAASAKHQNIYNVKNSQYLILQNSEILDIYKYIGDELFERVYPNKIKNYLFSVDPLDEYQACAIDSLLKDDMTIITGKPGSGKSLLSLAYCLKRIKEGASVHIFVNPVKARYSENLGYYSGDRNEKLLQNSIGDILKNKIGDIVEVESLMRDGAINIYPISDIRGIEIKKGDILYITEAQNLSIDLLKLAIQRCAEGSKIIIEGDPCAQIDDKYYMGLNNGLLRAIKLFENKDRIGVIELQYIYRSTIAELAEEL